MAEQLAVLVSVIIPTHARAILLERAIRSALDQTFKSFELVVVVDGVDPATVELLSSIDDERVKPIFCETATGGAGARNRGVKEAQGEWVAFLDDDDEWLPEKLDRQLSLALKSQVRYPVVSSQLLVRSSKGDLIWPRREPRLGEPISEYLFCRSGFFSGDGQLQTSAILTRRELLTVSPFNANIKKHDDTEWYLTVDARPDTEFLIVPQPLTVWHSNPDLPRVSLSGDWRETLSWANSCYTLMTSKAYASFILFAAGAEAANAGDFLGIVAVYREAFRRGSPTGFGLLFPLSFAVFPRKLRHTIRSWSAGLKSSLQRG
jgi:glycosyltransferase involved in cell wall biosynthesis